MIQATLAQLVEQQTENLRVWSSILRGGKRNIVMRKLLFFVVIVAVFALFFAGCTEEIEIIIVNDCDPVEIPTTGTAAARVIDREIAFTLTAGHETVKYRFSMREKGEVYTHGLISNLNHKIENFTVHNVTKTFPVAIPNNEFLDKPGGVITVAAANYNATFNYIIVKQDGNVYTFSTNLNPRPIPTP